MQGYQDTRFEIAKMIMISRIWIMINHDNWDDDFVQAKVKQGLVSRSSFVGGGFCLALPNQPRS